MDTLWSDSFDNLVIICLSLACALFSGTGLLMIWLSNRRRIKVIDGIKNEIRVDVNNWKSKIDYIKTKTNVDKTSLQEKIIETLSLMEQVSEQNPRSQIYTSPETQEDTCTNVTDVLQLIEKLIFDWDVILQSTNDSSEDRVWKHVFTTRNAMKRFLDPNLCFEVFYLPKKQTDDKLGACKPGNKDVCRQRITSQKWEPTLDSNLQTTKSFVKESATNSNSLRQESSIVSDLLRQHEELQKQLQNAVNERNDLTKRISDLLETNSAMKKKLTSIQNKHWNLKEEKSKSKDELNDSKIAHNKMILNSDEETDKSYLLERDLLIAKHKIERLKEDNQKLINEQNKTKQDFDHLRQECMNLQSEVNTKITEIDQKTKTLRLKENENQALRARLSKIAADKLLQGNPNIADLSDMNRPTKLGEMYSELYDNEWTDAYEGLLNSGKEETQAIEILKRTLLHTYKFCLNNAELVVHRTSDVFNLCSNNIRRRDSNEQSPDSSGGTEAVLMKEGIKLQKEWKTKGNKNRKRPNQEPQSPAGETFDVTEPVRKLMKESAVSMTTRVQDAYFDLFWKSGCVPSLEPFIKKSIFITWMMAVQNPPMCFHENTSLKLDTVVYRPYQNNGNNVAFIVWPALLLHQDGPVITKGVAEGC